MTSEERLFILEQRQERMSEDFEILHHSISRLPAIAIIMFSLGLIVGCLL